jgi:integrase
MNSNLAQSTFTGQIELPPNKPPAKRSYKDSGRTREYLETNEIDRLIAAVKNNRHSLRDQLIITMAYRHGLRVSELVALKWQQVIWDKARLYVNRVKGGEPSLQPIDGNELRNLRALKRKYPKVLD